MARINDAAAAAREDARKKGKFGEQGHSDPGEILDFDFGKEIQAYELQPGDTARVFGKRYVEGGMMSNARITVEGVVTSARRQPDHRTFVEFTDGRTIECASDALAFRRQAPVAPVDPTVVENLTFKYGVDSGEVNDLYSRLDNDTEAVETWLIRDMQADRHNARIGDALTRIRQIQVGITQDAAEGITSRILRDHPDVERICLAVSPGGRAWGIAGYTANEAINVYGDTQLAADLDSFADHIDTRDKMILAPLCVGHRFGTDQAEGLKCYPDGMVHEVWLNLKRVGVRQTTTSEA